MTSCFMSDMTAFSNRMHNSPYRGVLFFHIPKTAGSSLADAFCFSFEHFIRDAHLPASGWREIASGDESFFVSGHFSFSTVAETIDRPDVFSFTVLRDPLEQVVSNIKWVKAYGDPGRSDKLSELSPSIAELAKQLWTISLDDVGSLSSILKGAGAWPFRNIQTLLLQSEAAGQVARSPEEAVDCALANLKRFDLFFVLEDVAIAFEMLDQLLGPLEPMKHSNQAILDEQPNLADRVVREFYGDLVDLDLQLYGRAKSASRALLAEEA